MVLFSISPISFHAEPHHDELDTKLSRRHQADNNTYHVNRDHIESMVVCWDEFCIIARSRNTAPVHLHTLKSSSRFPINHHRHVIKLGDFSKHLFIYSHVFTACSFRNKHTMKDSNSWTLIKWTRKPTNDINQIIQFFIKWIKYPIRYKQILRYTQYFFIMIKKIFQSNFVLVIHWFWTDKISEILPGV